MHGHKEVDVTSATVEGQIAHEGWLEHGQELTGQDVQEQRAAGAAYPITADEAVHGVAVFEAIAASATRQGDLVKVP
jgi:hypothetical protein